MTEIASLRRIISIYEQIICAYELHHAQCKGISNSQDALERTVTALKKECSFSGTNLSQDLPSDALSIHTKLSQDSSSDPLSVHETSFLRKTSSKRPLSEALFVLESYNSIGRVNKPTQSKKRKINNRISERKRTRNATFDHIPSVEEWKNSPHFDPAEPVTKPLIQPALTPHIGGAIQAEGLAADLIATAEHHAQRTAQSIEHADFVCRTQLFLFLSYCVVLESREDVSLQELNRIMQVVVRGEGTEKFLKQLRTGARLMHTHVVLKLVEAGWSLGRATLMAFHCAPVRPYLYTYFTSHIALQQVERLKTVGYTGLGLKGSSTADFLTIWEPSLSIADFYRALGYKRSILRKSQAIIEQTRDTNNSALVIPNEPNLSVIQDPPLDPRRDSKSSEHHSQHVAAEVTPANTVVAWMATLAEMKKLRNITGDYLFEAMGKSSLRRREEDMGQSTLTDAMRLHPALNIGDDFVLEVCLCATAKETIAQAKASSFENLKCLLGDFLFGAVKTSKKRRDEEKKGIFEDTCAVDLTILPGGDGPVDGQLKMMLNFEEGWRILAEAYPV